MYETGETFAAKDRPFYIERHGRGETVYFDVSYSAVRETDGSVGGVLCIVTETTERVRFERRQAFLLELARPCRPWPIPWRSKPPPCAGSARSWARRGYSSARTTATA